MTASDWRRNTWICSFGSLINIVAMTVILPFLPQYIADMGVSEPQAVYVWSGLAYSATFVSAALLAPLWGRVSDRYGCRINLIRASAGMLVSMSLIALADSVWTLTLLRLLVGVAGGYTSGAAILVARQAPADRTGWAQGLLSTSILAGSVTGPLIGGALAAVTGPRPALIVTSALIGLNLLATLLIRETPPRGGYGQDSPFTDASTRQRRRHFTPWIRAMLVCIMALMFANVSIDPIIAAYVRTLGTASDRMALLAGVVLSAAALGSMVSSLYLGQLSDRIGRKRVIVICLISASITLLPQAYVTNILELGVLRFVMGLCLGGLLPCIRAAISQATAQGSVGTMLGLSTSFQYIGQVAGPIIGGLLAAGWGVPAVFWGTAALLLACASITLRVRPDA